MQSVGKYVFTCLENEYIVVDRLKHLARCGRKDSRGEMSRPMKRPSKIAARLCFLAKCVVDFRSADFS